MLSKDLDRSSSPDEGRRPLDGVEKVAAILLGMDKPSATRVLKHFDQQQLRDVTRAAARLGSIPVSLLESLIEDFSTDFATGAHLLGDLRQAQNLLTEALSADEAATILDDAFGTRRVDFWSQISSRSEQEIASIIAPEQPAVVAYIMSKLEPTAAGRVIGLLPRDLRNEVFCGLIDPPVIGERAAAIIAEVIHSELLQASQVASGRSQQTRVARLLNNLDPPDVEEVLQKIVAIRPDQAKALKRMLFAFADLPRLSQRARAILFDKLPIDTVVLALRGTDDGFRAVALSSMASRSRRLVESELASAGHASEKDIAKARKSIAETVLAMAQRDEIELPAEHDEDPSLGGDQL